MINLVPANERQSGNLPLVAAYRKRKPFFLRKLLFSAGVLLFLAGPAGYYLLPRLEAKKIANHLHATLVEWGDSLGQVNSGLDDLLTLVSGEEEPPLQTSFPNLPQLMEEWREKIAGERAKFTFYDLLYQLREDIRLVKESFSSIGGFGRSFEIGGIVGIGTMQFGDATDNLQQVRAQAQACKEVVDSSRGKLLLFSSALPKQFPAPLAVTGGGIDELVKKGDLYLLEAERTAHYYSVITDVQIELVPAVISIINLVLDIYKASDPTAYLGEVSALARTISDLNSKVEGLSASLPEGMTKLHNDNLAVFTLLSRLLDEVEGSLVEDDFGRFNAAIAEFETNLAVLATRAKSYELDFWQTTGLFKVYRDLSARYDRIRAGLERFR